MEHDEARCAPCVHHVEHLMYHGGMFPPDRAAHAGGLDEMVEAMCNDDLGLVRPRRKTGGNSSPVALA